MIREYAHYLLLGKKDTPSVWPRRRLHNDNVCDLYNASGVVRVVK